MRSQGNKMDSGDWKFGLFAAGCVAVGIGTIAAIVYIIVSIAKFAWGS